MNFRVVSIIRDPRDVVVSHAFYIAQNSKHFLFPIYKDLSLEDRICLSITGITTEECRLLNISDRVVGILNWSTLGGAYMARFERLVGPKGGGRLFDQKSEVQNILQHLRIQYSQKTIEYICQNLFGGTTTFRKGHIGSWKNHFTAEHKQLFKEIAGDLLIQLGYENSLDW